MDRSPRVPTYNLLATVQVLYLLTLVTHEIVELGSCLLILPFTVRQLLTCYLLG